MTTAMMSRSRTFLSSSDAERPVRVAEVDATYRPGTPGTQPVTVTDTQKWSAEASGGINLGIFHMNFKGTFGRSHSETKTVHRPIDGVVRPPLVPAGREPTTVSAPN